jgi:NTP pyrophosphatase (non-canonical NTP hydrolase)
MPSPEQFFREALEELQRARAKFPRSDCSLAALTEEVGELAKAMLDEPVERIWKEALQVAAMACRVATEGDPTMADYRKQQGLDS